MVGFGVEETATTTVGVGSGNGGALGDTLALTDVPAIKAPRAKVERLIPAVFKKPLDFMGVHFLFHCANGIQDHAAKGSNVDSDGDCKRYKRPILLSALIVAGCAEFFVDLLMILKHRVIFA